MQVMGATPHNPIFGLDLEKKALFFRQVASMVKAGISIGRSLEQASPTTLEQLGRDLSRIVEQGNPLSKAMRQFPQYFSYYESALVESGEQGGMLERSLLQLADYLERSLKLRRELLSQMVYPLLIIHVGIFIPPLYLLVQHSLMTYIFATVSVFGAFWGSILVAMLIWRALMNVPDLRRGFDTTILYIPMVGQVAAKLAMAKFLSCMAQLYEAGFLPVEAIKVSASACGNKCLEERLSALAPLVDKGMPPSVAIGKLQVISPIMMQLVSTGEQSGDAASMMQRAADMMDEDAQYSIKKVMVILPVIMLLCLGVVVGIYVIHFYTSTLGQIMGA